MRCEIFFVCSALNKDDLKHLRLLIGCGKSTQVPQFLLDANPKASIVVTQRESSDFSSHIKPAALVE